MWATRKRHRIRIWFLSFMNKNICVLTTALHPFRTQVSWQQNKQVRAKMSPNCHIYWIYSVLVGLAWMCAVNTTDHLCWMAKKMSSVWISQQPFKSSCFDRINRCSTWMQSFTFTNTDVMSDAGRILMMFGNKHNHARLTAYAYTTHTR